jgi:hypothetical protein
MRRSAEPQDVQSIPASVDLNLIWHAARAMLCAKGGTARVHRDRLGREFRNDGARP